MSPVIVDRRNWFSGLSHRTLILIGAAVLLLAVVLIATLSTTHAGGGYPISVNGKYGYMDNKGKVTVSPQFDAAQPYSDGYAAVELGNHWGYVDNSGKIIISPQYD